MITNETKKKIVDVLLKLKTNFTGSNAQFAKSIGINDSIFSRIQRGDYEQVLSEARWASLARRAGIPLKEMRIWKKADTPVFQYITAQLQHCQTTGVCSLLCDMSDIGKTYSARYYADNNKNAVYVDCGQVKSKQKFIRFIAKSFGVDHTGKYSDVYEDLVFYLKSLDSPLVILDEAGDLQYEAFLELKALYNATEYQCGFYMMGADGLRAKMERAINGKKVGYTELFSRFGKKYGTAVPTDKVLREKFLATTAAMIIRANAPEGTDVNITLRKTMGDDSFPSLRRIFIEFSKVNA